MITLLLFLRTGVALFSGLLIWVVVTQLVGGNASLPSLLIPVWCAGIGGGVVSVPLMTTFAKVPLRLAIATSSAAMILSAPLGAYRKVWTLPEMSDVEGPITAAITLSLIHI